jgi:hypothetical protein
MSSHCELDGFPSALSFGGFRLLEGGSGLTKELTSGISTKKLPLAIDHEARTINLSNWHGRISQQANAASSINSRDEFKTKIAVVLVFRRINESKLLFMQRQRPAVR